MKHFIPPWSGDPARYPAAALERHSAVCRYLNVEDDVTPVELRDLLGQVNEETRLGALDAADDSQRILEGMENWAPKEYTTQPPGGKREALRNPAFEHCALWGGRGGGKSHDVAEAIVEIGSTSKQRIVCAREFQTSIEESSKKLLEDKILASRWANEWTITEYKLTNNATGTTVTFMGMARNVGSAKSMEGCTIFWGEEAAAFSETSIDLLLPTIRKGKSRFFWTWNPDDTDAPIDKMFRSGTLPERSYVRCILTEDNPYFYTTRMPSERRTAFNNMTNAKYRHIWRGAYETNPEGAVYQDWSIGRQHVPDGIKPRYGLDWGFVDPLAALEIFVIEPQALGLNPEEEKGIIYISSELYERGLPSGRIPKRLDAKIPLARHGTITADSSEPKSIKDLQSQRFDVVGAVKGPGSIRAGISTIQGYHIVVSPDCPNVQSELTSYVWKKTKQGVTLRDPVDSDNHAMDALRYAMEDYEPPRKGGVRYV